METGSQLGQKAGCMKHEKDESYRVFGHTYAEHLAAKGCPAFTHPASPAERPARTALNLPWRVDPKRSLRIASVRDDETIASAATGSHVADAAINRAQFIVTACNNYEALRESHVAAIRLLDAVAEEMELADFDPTDTDTVYGQILEWLPNAKALTDALAAFPPAKEK
jgi:hypothetical protein